MKRSAPDFQQIPDRVYFRIGEVSHLVGVDTHVLRYWESEFSLIKPFRGKSKQRLYRRQDVENLLRIRALLHDEGYTISGARKYLKSQGSTARTNVQITESPASQADDGSFIVEIKQELRKILALLGGAKEQL